MRVLTKVVDGNWKWLDGESKAAWPLPHKNFNMEPTNILEYFILGLTGSTISLTVSSANLLASFARNSPIHAFRGVRHTTQYVWSLLCSSAPGGGRSSGSSSHHQWQFSEAVIKFLNPAEVHAYGMQIKCYHVEKDGTSAHRKFWTTQRESGRKRENLSHKRLCQMNTVADCWNGKTTEYIYRLRHIVFSKASVLRTSGGLEADTILYVTRLPAKDVQE